ncbi:DUF2933 domain-containing protein [Ralstonia pickettii]|uniref:DUF2933 domain-containing protein n=1 Tax=Ralstonia pickettii TaxID=329 RepID=UPI00046AD02A|nr:DUF2933 domain-containing protein [Ralstonia pickettii]
MTCKMKTIVKTSAAVIALLVLAYVTLPQLRPLITGMSPFLLILLCPVSMLLMMKGMRSNQEKAHALVQRRLPQEALREKASAE